LDEDEDKKFSQSDLYGTWEQINPDPADDGYDGIYHMFTSSQYSRVTDPIDINSFTYNYTWDSDGIITYENALTFTIRIEIQTLNANTLSFTKYTAGIYTDEYTCIKMD
jgi:hypothetical protein